MSAPAGAIVRIAPYDWGFEEPIPAEGDYLVSNGGSAYRIQVARQTRRPGRLALTCLKLAGQDEIPAGARVVGIRWYSRDRKPRPKSFARNIPTELRG